MNKSEIFLEENTKNEQTENGDQPTIAGKIVDLKGNPMGHGGHKSGPNSEGSRNSSPAGGDADLPSDSKHSALDVPKYSLPGKDLSSIPAQNRDKESKNANRSEARDLKNSHAQESNGDHDYVSQREEADGLIKKFMRNLNSKLDCFMQDHKNSVEDPAFTRKAFDSYLRGMSISQLKEFLSKYPDSNGDYVDHKDNDEDVPMDDEEDDLKLDIKSVDSDVEIKQEEIIMMTNLSSTISCFTEADSRRLREKNHITNINKEKLVPISLCLTVEDLVIKDQFLWNADTIDRNNLKQFAVQLLAEKAGRTKFSYISKPDKERFCESVSELIKYNVNVYNSLNMSDYIATVEPHKEERPSTDNTENNNKVVDHIANIIIRLHSDEGELIEDTFKWDFTCPLNHPERFAAEYCNDLRLGKAQERLIAFSIRKQVFDHLKQINSNKKYNLLQSLGIPVNQSTLKICPDKRIGKQREPGRYEKSDASYLDYTDNYPQNDYMSSVLNRSNDDRHRNHNFAYKGAKEHRYKGRMKRPKPSVPKTIRLIVKKILPEEGSSDAEVKYQCEQLIVGNRKTKVTQKNIKVKKELNRRTLKKRDPTTAEKEQSSSIMEEHKEYSEPMIVQGIISCSESNSDSESQDVPEVIPQIVNEICMGEGSESESDNQSDASGYGSSSHV